MNDRTATFEVIASIAINLDPKVVEKLVTNILTAEAMLRTACAINRRTLNQLLGDGTHLVQIVLVNVYLCDEIAMRLALRQRSRSGWLDRDEANKEPKE